MMNVTRRSLIAGGVGLVMSSGAVAQALPQRSASPDHASAPGIPTPVAGFDTFSEFVTTYRDGDEWVVECKSLPNHPLMVGIRNWQQQVPIPQSHLGQNAWRLPVLPTIAVRPLSARNAFFRGAIAIAVNGTPIFNPMKNRDEDVYLGNELDQWGGHCGRSDDYHYHVAPLHLQETVGAGQPIGYALDGFPIFGEREIDGSPVGHLDDLNGHTDANGGYHYHGTRTYPYINGGFRGIISTDGDQVVPQPSTRPIRPPGAPLRDVEITDFAVIAPQTYRLVYRHTGRTESVQYTVAPNASADTVVSAQVTFVFTDATGATRTEIYSGNVNDGKPLGALIRTNP